ncbi:MAG: Gfo/Idh/MocA family oxidoreductase [Clostridiales bacterium]|jgi:predicted dehydrogenase|nr:Gfo/Idh/MocA family oxidoreductase [Clostridiales bacterium]
MKIGTVGSGFIVTDFLNAARDVPGVETTAVYSRTMERAEAFAKERGAKLAFCDRDEFLNSKDFDFVYIASPNSMHFKWAKDALLAGKNVICEKPFFSNIKETREIIELAYEKNLFLFEAVTVPHLPNYKLLNEHLKDIGDIKVVQINFSQYSSRYDKFINGEKPNVFNPEFSGGALMDINFYNLYFIVGLFGRPNNLNYFANVRDGIDTSGILVLEYDGFLATAVGCKDSKSLNSVQIQGDEGFINIPEESSRCISVDINTKGGSAVYNEQQNAQAHFYEIRDFEEIYSKKDYIAMKNLLKNSLLVSEMLDEARKKAGIVFKADK